MFKRLFGSSSSSSTPPPAVPDAQSANRTINTIQSLSDHEEQLEKRKELLEKRMEGELQKAKQYNSQGKKSQAMQVCVCVGWLIIRGLATRAGRRRKLVAHARRKAGRCATSQARRGGNLLPQPLCACVHRAEAAEHVWAKALCAKSRPVFSVVREHISCCCLVRSQGRLVGACVHCIVRVCLGCWLRSCHALACQLCLAHARQYGANAIAQTLSEAN